MIPELLRLGSIPINSFGLMVALAMCAAWLRIEADFRKSGLPEKLAERYVLVGTLAGLAGARIWYVFHHSLLQAEDNVDFGAVIDALFSFRSGFVFYGGFLLAAALVAAMASFDRIRLHLIADSIGPGLALAYMVGRLGCQLSGDGDYGLPTDSAFGMSYAFGAYPTPSGERVIPTPLIESALSALVLLILTSISHQLPLVAVRNGRESAIHGGFPSRSTAAATHTVSAAVSLQTDRCARCLRGHPWPRARISHLCAEIFGLIAAQDSQKLVKQLHQPWRRFGLYLALMSLERFVVEFLRAEPRYAVAVGGSIQFALSEAQMFAVIGLIIGSILMIRPFGNSKPQYR